MNASLRIFPSSLILLPRTLLLFGVVGVVVVLLTLLLLLLPLAHDREGVTEFNVVVEMALTLELRAKLLPTLQLLLILALKLPAPILLLPAAAVAMSLDALLFAC